MKTLIILFFSLMILCCVSKTRGSKPKTLWKTTYYQNGKLKDSISLLDSNNIEYRNGFSFHNDSFGKLRLWQEFRLNKKVGKEIIYDSSGNVISFGFYKEGRRHGNYYHLYTNECIKQLDSFQFGQQLGKSTTFDSFGNITQKGINKTTGFHCGSCFCK